MIERQAEHPDTVEIFGINCVYDGVFQWHGSLDQYNLKINFNLINEEDSDEDLDFENDTFVHCNIYHYDNLVSIGIAHDFYFAAIDAKLHHFIRAVSSLNSEMKTIMHDSFRA